MFSITEAVIVHEIIERAAILLVEIPAEISAVGTHHVCHIRELESRIEIDFLHFKETLHLGGETLLFLFTLLRSSFCMRCLHILQFINHRLMSIPKVTDEHPDSQGADHIKIVEASVDDKAAKDPDNQDEEETAQDGKEPGKVDVLLIGETLLELAMIPADEEEEYNEGGDAINGTPYRENIKIDVGTRDEKQERKQHKRQLQHHRLGPGGPSRFYQFHQHKAIERNDKHIDSGGEIPSLRTVETLVVEEHEVFQALCIHYQHQKHDEAEEPFTALTPKHPCHHGKEHHAHSINKTRYSIHILIC